MTISLTADTVGLYSLQSGLSMPLMAVPVRLDVPRHSPAPISAWQDAR